MQKFIRQIVLVFGGFLYFKFFEGISQFVTPSEAWHDNSDIVWRKKISLNKKNSVLKVLILIVCWPENGRPILAPPRNDVWLTREDQQRMTNEVSLLRVLLIGWNKFHFWNYEYMKIIYIEWRIIWKKIIAVVYATYACSCEKKAWKKIRPLSPTRVDWNGERKYRHSFLLCFLNKYHQIVRHDA